MLFAHSTGARDRLGLLRAALYPFVLLPCCLFFYLGALSDTAVVLGFAYLTPPDVSEATTLLTYSSKHMLVTEYKELVLAR